MKSIEFTEGRRGWRQGDNTPKRKVWPTLQEAVDSMRGNDVAFVVHDMTDERPGWTNPFIVSIMAEYAVVTREKASRPWKKTGSVLATCLADAQDRSGARDDPRMEKCMLVDEWAALQTRQHLKSLK